MSNKKWETNIFKIINKFATDNKKIYNINNCNASTKGKIEVDISALYLIALSSYSYGKNETMLEYYKKLIKHSNNEIENILSISSLDKNGMLKIK